MQPFRGILCLTAILGATLVAALAGHGWGRAAQRPSQAEELPLPAPVDRAHTAVAMIGARSCASTACHGSVRPDPRSRGTLSNFIRRDEYVAWSDHDPHARSLLTLESERSQQIFAALQIKDAGGKVIDERTYNNCRACHATKVTDPATKTVSYESISCEACHGPAEHWRESHYQRSWNDQVAARSGFANTKNLAVRAGQCAQCHVGAADREVNHDLIAAGHPVLKFELAAYHDMLPKHWNDARERAQTTDFELALWSAGQQQTAQAALALTHARLERIDSTAAAQRSPVKPVWPELAEFDCFACHHDLVDGSWSRAAGDPLRSLAAWNTWNLAQLPAASLPQLAELQTLMPQQLRSADEQILGKVAAARRELAKLNWRDHHQVGGSIDHWDRAAQAYLHRAAQFRARQDAARKANQPWEAEGEVKQLLLGIRKGLAFDNQYDSPRAGDADQSAMITRQLQAIDKLLSQGDRQ